MTIDPVNVAAELDEDLGQQAVRAAEQFVEQSVRGKLTIRKEDDWPIRRSQIAGLRLVATNEPDCVAKFARRQCEREQKKRGAREKPPDSERDIKSTIFIDFWELVEQLCASSTKGQGSWSLQQACDAATPAEYRADDQTPNAKLTPEQRQERNRRRQQRQEFQQQWKAAYYPAFFQRFCAHYLYAMSRMTQRQGDRTS